MGSIWLAFITHSLTFKVKVKASVWFANEFSLPARDASIALIASNLMILSVFKLLLGAPTLAERKRRTYFSLIYCGERWRLPIYLLASTMKMFDLLRRLRVKSKSRESIVCFSLQVSFVIIIVIIIRRV